MGGHASKGSLDVNSFKRLLLTGYANIPAGSGGGGAGGPPTAPTQMRMEGYGGGHGGFGGAGYVEPEPSQQIMVRNVRLLFSVVW